VFLGHGPEAAAGLGAAAGSRVNGRQYQVHLPNAGGTDRGASVTGGEFAAIDRLRRRLPSPPPGELWVGDDAAVVTPQPGPLLLTTDMAVAGVHGDLSVIGADDFGWRAMVAAVSDVAAMGGRPGHAVVAVAVPPGADLDALYDGLAAAASEHGSPIVGGDLTAGPTLVVAVAVTGWLRGPEPAVRRGGAGPGDALFVTGPLGGSAVGLRTLRAQAGAGDGAAAPVAAIDGVGEAHRRPRARLAEGETARLAGASAMIDVSDGLAADLGHLADESGVGVVLDDVPCAPGATVLDALGGGEDYELVLATPEPGRLLDAFAAAGLRRPVRIGVCVEDPSVRTLGDEAIPAVGWEHEIS